jgi:hypothetical protein
MIRQYLVRYLIAATQVTFVQEPSRFDAPTPPEIPEYNSQLEHLVLKLLDTMGSPTDMSLEARLGWAICWEEIEHRG